MRRERFSDLAESQRWETFQPPISSRWHSERFSLESSVRRLARASHWRENTPAHSPSTHNASMKTQSNIFKAMWASADLRHVFSLMWLTLTSKAEKLRRLVALINLEESSHVWRLVINFASPRVTESFKWIRSGKRKTHGERLSEMKRRANLPESQSITFTIYAFDVVAQ